MGLFRRREPLHERLAREGGLVEREPRAPWQEVGIHGIPRPRDADVTLAVEADGIDGDAATFVVLPDGTLLVEDGPDSSFDALAAAIEQQLPPPYRARAARRGEKLWAVQGTKIEVISLSDAPDGDVVDLTRHDGETTLAVDARQEFGSVPALETRGEREGRDFAVHAERLDGDLWEVRAAAL
jgi:hypothetical protein